MVCVLGPRLANAAPSTYCYLPRFYGCYRVLDAKVVGLGQVGDDG